ncbi:MAG: DUF1622 domain-containing protein [Hymenobacter sp.]
MALALEFQLGADILSTAIAPSWEQIGKLGRHCRDSHGAQLFSSRSEMQQERRRNPQRREARGAGRLMCR